MSIAADGSVVAVSTGGPNSDNAYCFSLDRGSGAWTGLTTAGVSMCEPNSVSSDGGLVAWSITYNPTDFADPTNLDEYLYDRQTGRKIVLNRAPSGRPGRPGFSVPGGMTPDGKIVVIDSENLDLARGDTESTTGADSYAVYLE